MDREILIKTLTLAEPALSDTNLVHSFTHFMFTGKDVLAYNQTVGAIAPCKTGLAPFAVAGAPLLGLLRNSQAEELNISLDDTSLIIKAGKSTFKLPTLQVEEYLWEAPNEKWLASADLNEDIMEGIQVCLATSSRNMAEPAIMGVCLNFTDKGAVLYSCDGDSVTRYRPESPAKGSGTYTVPNAFCDALIRAVAETEITTGSIMLNDAWVCAKLKGGPTLYGNLIEKNGALDHEELIKESLPGKQKFVPVPEGFNEALSRARVLADFESAKTKVTVSKGKMQLVTDAIGTVRDELLIKDQPDIAVAIHASLAQQSLTICNEICLQENCCAYRNGSKVLRVVSNQG